MTDATDATDPDAPIESEDDAVDDAIDGRTARRDRNRVAVLDAVLELFAEGELEPSAADAAARSGVSLRSVYRYYEDLEALLRAAIARSLERNLPFFDVPEPGVGPLDERIDRIVRARIGLHDHVGDIARAALLRSRSNALIAGQLNRQRALLRAQNAAMFAPELSSRPAEERADVLSAIELLIGLEAFELLRHVQGRTFEDTHRVLTRALAAVLVGSDQTQPPA